MGVELSGFKFRGIDHEFMKRNGGGDTVNHKFIEGAIQPPDGVFPVAGRNDQLGDQGIIKGRNRIGVVNMGINPDSGPSRQVEIVDGAGGGA